MLNIDPLLNTLGLINPWPTVKPNVPSDPHHWFAEANAYMLDKLLKPTHRVLEIGSWLGGSTRFIAEHCHQIIAVDHWLGSSEHHSNPEFAKKLPTLYDTFLVNCWHLKDKILPLRMSSETAFKLIKEKQLSIDLVYIDGDHSFEGAYKDICTAWELKAIITGDDWLFGHDLPVRRAVQRFCKEKNLIARDHGNFWWI